MNLKTIVTGAVRARGHRGSGKSVTRMDGRRIKRGEPDANALP